jgi:oligoribonuclease (3'-5' exoribonuclease)
MNMRLGQKGQRFFIIDYETNGIDEDSVPIEVGIIVTDEHFNAIDALSTLIAFDHQDGTWSAKDLHAFKVHGIHPNEFRDEGTYSAGSVRDMIRDLAKRHTSKTGQRPVLVSDNIQFEWKHTARLLGGEEWPFHYCGWDSSLLLEATGVGDPKPAHRALADAGLLHAAILKALDRIKR